MEAFFSTCFYRSQLTLIKKYKNLYDKFKQFKPTELIVTLVLSTNSEDAFDFIKQDANSLDFEKFIHNLSTDELKQLDSIKDEFESLMSPKFESFFKELEHSNMNEELKEKSDNKEFKVSIIFS